MAHLWDFLRVFWVFFRVVLGVLKAACAKGSWWMGHFWDFFRFWWDLFRVVWGVLGAACAKGLA